MVAYKIFFVFMIFIVGTIGLIAFAPFINGLVDFHNDKVGEGELSQQSTDVFSYGVNFYNIAYFILALFCVAAGIAFAVEERTQEGR